MKNFKKWLRDSIPARLKKFISYSEEVEYGRISFSQFGEDMILRNFFSDKPMGFYIDVGAHHPIKYSNTYYFYKLGWHGIVIDPLPGFKNQFLKTRPRDIALEYGVSKLNGEIDYFCFKEPLENTFSEEKARGINQNLNPMKEIIKVKVCPLAQVLDEFLPAQFNIDLLSIDAEGLDLVILESNNWTKYRPKVIVVENLNSDLSEITRNPITEYLYPLGYRLKSVSKSALFFERL